MLNAVIDRFLDIEQIVQSVILTSLLMFVLVISSYRYNSHPPEQAYLESQQKLAFYLSAECNLKAEIDVISAALAGDLNYDLFYPQY